MGVGVLGFFSFSFFQFLVFSYRSKNMWKLYRSFRSTASLSALRNRRIDDFELVDIFKIFERDGNSFTSTDVLRHMKTNWCEILTDEEVDVMIPKGRHRLCW